MKYVDYWFQDAQTGEDFFVEVEDIPGSQVKAIGIAEFNFPEPKLVCAVSPGEAEAMGFDTY
jgi:hypothetical protein